MPSSQLRCSLLNVPDSLTPLKFKGWIREEVAGVQQSAKSEFDVIIIKLFAPQRIISGLGQRKVDEILGALVNKHPNIHRIELEATMRSLTAEEMSREAESAREWIRETIDSAEGEGGVPPPTLH